MAKKPQGDQFKPEHEAFSDGNGDELVNDLMSYSDEDEEASTIEDFEEEEFNDDEEGDDIEEPEEEDDEENLDDLNEDEDDDEEEQEVDKKEDDDPEDDDIDSLVKHFNGDVKAAAKGYKRQQAHVTRKSRLINELTKNLDAQRLENEELRKQLESNKSQPTQEPKENYNQYLDSIRNGDDSEAEKGLTGLVESITEKVSKRFESQRITQVSQDDINEHNGTLLLGAAKDLAILDARASDDIAKVKRMTDKGYQLTRETLSDLDSVNGEIRLLGDILKQTFGVGIQYTPDQVNYAYSKIAKSYDNLASQEPARTPRKVRRPTRAHGNGSAPRQSGSKNYKEIARKISKMDQDQANASLDGYSLKELRIIESYM